MKKGLIWFIGFLLIAVAGFFITSLCLASNHGNTLTEEWKSWTVEKVKEKEDKEETKEDEEPKATIQIEDDLTEE